MAAKFREIFAENKQATQNFDVERFNLSKTRQFEITKINQIKIWNRFAALENLNDAEDINKTLKNIKENSKTST